MPRWHKNLLFCEGVCWCLTFDKTPLPTPEVDSDDKEYLPTADLDDSVLAAELVLDSQEYLYIPEIPRPATPALQPNHVDISPTQPQNPIKWRSQQPHSHNLTK